MKSSRQRFKARRVADFVVALSAVVLLTHYAATKPTNQLENCEIVELWNSGNGKLRNGGATGITVDDVERGYAVSLARTNETCSFSMPAGAEEARRWRIRGASSDWIAFDAGGWTFPIGTNSASAFCVDSSGRVDAFAGAVRGPPLASFLPVNAPLGVVPEANWRLLPESARPSRFWHHLTPSNTLQFTWENALLGRAAANPVSFQVELSGTGAFVYRYDLTRVAAPDTNLFATAVFNSSTNSAIPLFHNSTIPQFHNTLSFYPLHPSDLDDPDPDGDGIPTADEIRVHGTDPHLADTDEDGLSDYDELFVHGTDPFNPRSLGGLGSDGLAARLAGENPFAFPDGSTNTVYEHVFYSGTTNGPVAFPQSTENLAVLRVGVSGDGEGDLMVGDRVYPLLPPPRLRSGAATNTLLIAVGKGRRERLWWRRPEGLEVALGSEDFMVGELPSLYPGWIAFPFTDATIPCIHRLSDRSVRVRLVTGFPDMTATWSSGSADVVVTNLPPDAAKITGRFDADEEREVVYTVWHPDRLAGQTNYTQSVRFCPNRPPPRGESPDVTEGESHYVMCKCSESVSGTCRCDCAIYGHEGNMMCNCGKKCSYYEPPEMTGDEAAAAEDDYGAAVVLQPLEGVLHLYGDNADQVHLDVPVGAFTNCCPCPEHNRSNFVAAAYSSSRLEVLESNDVFRISYRPCDVTVRGVAPSRSFNDASVCFSTNGGWYIWRDYTVLGLKVDTPCDLPPIEVYNRLSPSLGFPATVCTDEYAAASLILRNDLLLTNGVVRVAVENAAGDVRICFAGSEDYYADPETVLDTAFASERFFPIRHWYRLVRRHNPNLGDVAFRVLASAPGAFDLVFEYAATNGNRVVHDVARQRVTAIRPPLLVDRNRNGELDESDVAAIADGEMVYFWKNDDKWKGDDAFDESLVNFRNSLNGVVDGRNDLVNFLPVAVDVGTLLSSWGAQVDFWIAPGVYSPGVRQAKVALADCAWDRLGEVPFGDFLDTAGNPLRSAPVEQLGSAKTLPSGFVALSPYERSTMLMEFPEAARGEALVLEVRIAGLDVVLYSFPLYLHVGEAEKMVIWQNLRAVAGGSDGKPSTSWAQDWPAGEHEPGYVVFVHGYNMAEDAEVPFWAVNVFKKLWWAGLDRGFVAVQWFGNEGQTYVPFEGWVTPNYYGNVQNAFATASALKTAMDGIDGPKWFLAHSLGNMLVSAAIQDHQMPHERYFMLNAAVPMEAFDPTNGITQASHDNMTPVAWTNYADRVRSTHWHELFPDGDGRRLLTWKGRFCNVTNTVNFYSTQEEVVNNGDGAPKDIGREFSWYNQECRKGDWTLMLHPNEGGWAFNSYYDIGLLLHMAPADAAELTDAQLRQTPFFLDFDDQGMHTSSNGVIVSSNYLYRAEMLAYAIPSESYAVGANPLIVLADEDLNVNMADFTAGQEDLPENGNKAKYKYRDWQHSTFVQRSYKRTRQLFKKIIEITKGEVQE